MATVTGRIKEIKQPRGGYLNPKEFHEIDLPCSEDLFEVENVHSSLIGLVVDYLTRFQLEGNLESAFEISLMGANNARKLDEAYILLNNIKGLDDKSIKCATRLVGYDVCYRAGIEFFSGVDTIDPDNNTIYNIRTMVERGISFAKEFGPITKYGFGLEGSFTDIIVNGDGDFLTEDTLWDFKVIKGKITNKHTLQILIYFLMGKKSIHNYFEMISRIGIFNPRLNKVYLINVSDINGEVIKAVETDVIGY